jgi:hypothetical protein
MNKINLKKDLKSLSEKNCIEATENSIEFSMYDLLGKCTPLESIIGLSSAILNMSDSYVSNKQQVINILENVIAQIELDEMYNVGKKLN